MIEGIGGKKNSAFYDIFAQYGQEEVLFVDGDQVINQFANPNIVINHGMEEQTVKIWITIKENAKIGKPFYLCVGFQDRSGKQLIDYHMVVEKNVQVDFVSHCYFPKAESFTHQMNSTIEIGENAKVTYRDFHYHGDSGIIKVDSNYDFLLKDHAEIKNYFELKEERAGCLNLRGVFRLGHGAKAYSETKLKERLDDMARVEEVIYLNGDHSSGIAKSFIVGEDESSATVINEVYGYGNYTHGHIECDEVIAGEKVKLSAIPKLVVTNNTSEITHEASVGRLNTDQLETLMTKGLTEEEASQMIINGIFED